jgi:hypothetical protein
MTPPVLVQSSPDKHCEIDCGPQNTYAAGHMVAEFGLHRFAPVRAAGGRRTLEAGARLRSRQQIPQRPPSLTLRELSKLVPRLL